MGQDETYKQKTITLENLSIETRNNPELMVRDISNLITLYGCVILDCGCITAMPKAEVNLIELEDGSYLAVCSKCQRRVFESDSYIGSLPTKFSC
jgi:hypothetical protein